jgi:hypothetical protein
MASPAHTCFHGKRMNAGQQDRKDWVQAKECKELNVRQQPL